MIRKKSKRVFVVDDSALMRKLITEILNTSDDLQVVGVARDPYVAWEKIHQLEPDVITLDVDMPRMDGIEFLRKLMIARPTPVVMISSLTEANCITTLRALEFGAVDYVSKPKIDVKAGTIKRAWEIIDKVSMASRVALKRPTKLLLNQRPTILKRESDLSIQESCKLIAIGASTGGTEAIGHILMRLPPDVPGMVIVQHMPANFTKRFADRLNKNSRLHVREAKCGDRVLPGTALIAPGGRHMEVVECGGVVQVVLNDRAPVERFRPSVDVLFHSVATEIGKECMGVLLTGMGEDGAIGLKAMHDAGATTLAQDEASCVVFGMPKAAIEKKAVDSVCDLEGIVHRLAFGIVCLNGAGA